MSVMAVLAPAFVQVALCFALLGGLIVARALAVRAGRVAYQDAARGASVWPRRAQQIGDSYKNQFELPVLFFALVPLAVTTRNTDAVFVGLEWAFVIGRLAQATVHVTINVVVLRGLCFFLSAMALGLAWVELLFDLVAA